MTMIQANSIKNVSYKTYNLQEMIISLMGGMRRRGRVYYQI